MLAFAVEFGRFDSIVDGFGKTGSVCNGGCRLDGVSVSVLESFHHDKTKLAASRSSLFAFPASVYSQKENIDGTYSTMKWSLSGIRL